jgi:hypothetical protein
MTAQVGLRALVCSSLSGAPLAVGLAAQNPGKLQLGIREITQAAELPKGQVSSMSCYLAVEIEVF